MAEAVELAHRRPLARPAPARERHPLPGMNILLLWGAAIDGQGYRSNVWMTYKQAEEKGARSARVSAARSSSTPTATPRPRPTTAARRAEREIAFLKGYTVFNVEQIDGLPAELTTPPRTDRRQPHAGADRPRPRPSSPARVPPSATAEAGPSTPSPPTISRCRAAGLQGRGELHRHQGP
jgi:hypothetical protein